ncbi:MAG: cell envelope integrity protein TolA [Porticoccaceae bacterium]|nr:cell envelope integrity protein TolA [Porticoccaceae bacterium]
MMRSASELLSTLRGALRLGVPRNVDAASSYTWPVAISVLFHGALLVFIAIGWGPSEKPRKVVTPRYVEAQLLQMNAPVIQPEAEQPKAEQPQPQPQPKEDTAAREREERQRQEEQRRQEQQRQEAVRQEQARQEQQRKEQEARAEAERKRQAEQKRKEEQAKAEAQKRAEEQKRLEEQKRQEEQRRQQAERERQQREAREAQARAAQAQADAEAREQLVGSYLGYIQQQVSTRWSRPPSARLGMVTELEIRLDGQARVIGVRVVRSSGNSAFDQAAEHAVRRVEQFDRLRELIQQDRTAFEQNFRTFILKFNPQDLRQ